MKRKEEKNNREGFYRRSYFGPILLITIGLVFLGKNIGWIPGEGWDTVWRLWPLLLIIGGLDELFRREGVAWPVLMISFGAVILYHYFGPRSLISWTQIFQLWPVLIIAVGIDVLFKGQSGWMSLLGVVLSIVLIGAAVLLAVQGVQVQADYLTISEGYSSEVDSAELDLELGVGQFFLEAGKKSGKLIAGSVTPGNIRDDMDLRSGYLSYSLESTKPAFFPHTARWELELTPDLPLDLKLDNPVGEMLLDLAGLELESVLANQGVGRIYIGLPDDVAEEVLIKQGVGLIEVEIPDDIRIAVDAQNGLTRVKFPAGFELEDGYYTTPGATRSNAQLFIVVEQGVGQVSFRYSE